MQLGANLDFSVKIRIAGIAARCMDSADNATHQQSYHVVGGNFKVQKISQLELFQ